MREEGELKFGKLDERHLQQNERDEHELMNFTECNRNRIKGEPLQQDSATTPQKKKLRHY